MAIITGLTAERMEEIEAASIVDGSIVGDNLILEKHDGSTINAGNVRGPIGAKPPFVTSLPSSPTDLDEIYFQTTAMASLGIAWHLKYRQGTGKWQYLGGAPWVVEGVGGTNNSTNEITTSLASTTLTTPGPAITIPVAGVYDVEGSAQAGQVGSGSAPGLVIWQTGDAAVNWANAPALSWSGNETDSQQTLILKKRITVSAANNVLELRYVTSNATGGSKFRNRCLRVTPVLLG